MLKLEINVDVRGDIALIYSPTMKCEFSCKHAELTPTLQKLVDEWIEIHRAECTLPDPATQQGPYTLLIGGSTVDEAHSTESFATKEERLSFWRSYTAREYAWLPLEDGTWIPNTEKNCATVAA